MNILSNRLQATPRIQIQDGKKLQSKSHSLLSPSLPKHSKMKEYHHLLAQEVAENSAPSSYI
jgi:hypothetical protein